MEPDKKLVDSTPEEKPVEEFSWASEKATEYIEREDFVILTDFVEKGRNVKFKVRGLTGPQRAEVEEAGRYTDAQVQTMFETMLRALGKDETAITPAFNILFGTESAEDNELPPGYIKVMKIFYFGSVGIDSGESGWNETIKFFTRHYFDALEIVAKIQELSALGYEAKKKPI